MTSVTDTFMRWWNSLASRNGKLKFTNQKEAAEFVRRVYNESQGPNAKILEMRRQYDKVNRDRDERKSG